MSQKNPYKNYARLFEEDYALPGQVHVEQEDCYLALCKHVGYFITKAEYKRLTKGNKKCQTKKKISRTQKAK